MLNQQIEKAIEEHWPMVQKTIYEKVPPSAFAVAKDDETMQLLLTPVYMALPFPVRLVTKKEVFMNFCLKHRDRFISTS